MIISNLFSGLGNQLFQYAAGYALAKHHQTELKLDNLYLLDQRKRYYNTTYRPYSLDAFNISGKIATPAEINRFITPRLGNRYLYHLKKRIFSQRNVYTETVVPTYEKLIQLPENAYLTGYFQKYTYLAPIIEDLKNEFSFKNPLPAALLPVYENILKTNSVGVHFRRGDYLTDPNLNIVSMDYYMKGVEILKEKLSSVFLFVFSDDIDWCKENFNCPDVTVCYIDQKDYDNNINDKDYLQLMTFCKHFIIPNSTYSYWAALLSSHPDKLVIAPEKWNRMQQQELSEILPDDWIHL